jgi:hypothetical protein
MSKSNTFESDLLLHIFQNANIALVGDATGLRGSTAAGNLYVSLHTADPGEASNQGTSEATYTGYARVAVVRSSGGWTISGTAPTQAANAAQIDFAACTAGSNTITHAAVGTDPTGTGKLLYSGALAASLAVSAGITPFIAAGAAVFTED